MKQILQSVRAILPEEQIFEREAMKNHITFRVGGEADLFLEIKTKQQLQQLLELFYETKTEYFLLGNGSNLLVGDKGYRGVILHIGTEMSDIEVCGNRILAQAGAMLVKVANMAMNAGLAGMEFASGIPGSIGGGVMMNAGAYGGEMSQIVSLVKGFTKDGTEVSFTREQMEFGYRSSIVKREGIVVTDVELTLKEGDADQIKAEVTRLSEERRAKQPLEYPSAGSTFKRPEGYFAGKLIMDAGLRGYQVGGAQVSEKHCGFVINKGDATAKDIKTLMADVQEKVKAEFGVILEPEVICLGEF
ncbi:MAG: UDP-N-acetylmuramate dehydrogenase [Lachnospiraceae bacterium]|nr:UDP-N-acetylmuramate dehydrogenase [Lachnospiraceae bacterium]